MPKTLGNAQACQPHASLLAGSFDRLDLLCPVFDQGLGHHVQRRHPGYYAQELADIAHGVAAHAHQFAWQSLREFKQATIGLLHLDLATGGAVVCVHQLEQGAFAHARWAIKDHTLTGRHAHVHLVQHLEFGPILVVQREALGHLFHLQHHGL